MRYKIFDNDCEQKKIIHIRSKRTGGVSDDNSLPWLEHPRDFSDPDCTDPPTNWQPRNTGATISFLNRIFFTWFHDWKKNTLWSSKLTQSLCLLVPFPFLVTIACLWCPFWFPCCERADNCTDKQRARMVKSFQETTFANLPPSPTTPLKFKLERKTSAKNAKMVSLVLRLYFWHVDVPI